MEAARKAVKPPMPATTLRAVWLVGSMRKRGMVRAMR